MNANQTQQQDLDVSRRAFLRRSAAFSLGFAGLHMAMGSGGSRLFAAEVNGAAGGLGKGGFGPLVKDPRGIFDLPKGFTYEIISRAGQKMDDGLVVPGRADGMAAFAGPDGLTIIVCNYELGPEMVQFSSFGKGNEGLAKIDAAKLFDRGRGIAPSLGGTTTLVYDTKTGKLLKQWLSLAGTNRNCAGGPTPWGSWLSCEEDVAVRGGNREQSHGYVFEVPATTKVELVDAVPIKAMGRFNHEAVCIDPRTGVVYLTEDRVDGLIYRFVPKERGKLLMGGSLEALVITGSPSRDTGNLGKPSNEFPVLGDTKAIAIGTKFECEWVAMDDVESPKDDLRHRGYQSGAARFARGEGMWWGHDSAYFACTSGGTALMGQLWRYTPSTDESAPATLAGEGVKAMNTKGGTLELFVEPNDSKVVQNADNVTVSPSGELFVCEDGEGPNRLLRVEPNGDVTTFARNALSASELAGACFSPDGTTLFVNIQTDHLTLAVRGPFGG